jgi:hypothetical protein
LYLSDLKTQLVPCSEHYAWIINTDKLVMYSETVAIVPRSI